MGVKTVRKRPTTEAHDEKRIEIIQHCATLFDKVGFHNTSMQMLADEVGLGKPTLYHYFPSKLSILYAIHDAHIGVLLDGLQHEAGADPAGLPALGLYRYPGPDRDASRLCPSIHGQLRRP